MDADSQEDVDIAESLEEPKVCNALSLAQDCLRGVCDLPGARCINKRGGGGGEGWGVKEWGVSGLVLAGIGVGVDRGGVEGEVGSVRLWW